MTDLLDLPFLLLVTHPFLFFAGLLALYALCYLPGVSNGWKDSSDV